MQYIAAVRWLRELFARAWPAPVQSFECVDVRCKNARFKVPAVEGRAYQIAHARVTQESAGAPHVEEAEHDKWVVSTSAEWHRIVPRLEPSTTYACWCRARAWCGTSAWTEPLLVTTLQRPVQAGGRTNTFTWTQTADEVSVAMTLPHHISSREVYVHLRPRHLEAGYKTPQGNIRLVCGDLVAQVRLLTPEGGSYWELDRQRELRLVVVLERVVAATSTKWGFWRSVFVGGPEIDTHAIPLEALPAQARGGAGTGGATLMPGSAGLRERRLAGDRVGG